MTVVIIMWFRYVMEIYYTDATGVFHRVRNGSHWMLQLAVSTVSLLVRSILVTADIR